MAGFVRCRRTESSQDGNLDILHLVRLDSLPAMSAARRARQGGYSGAVTSFPRGFAFRLPHAVSSVVHVLYLLRPWFRL